MVCGAWCVVRVGQASVNPKAETVEELLARRKNLHIGMVKLAREDLSLYLQANIDTHKVSSECAHYLGQEEPIMRQKRRRREGKCRL